MATDVATIDRHVLDLLRGEQPQSIGQLSDALGVTATAVRQRLSRLMAQGLVQRDGVRQVRGRPLFRYTLTEKGRQSSGTNLDDLARALWEEVRHLDVATRHRLLAGVMRQLVERYATEIEGRTLEERLSGVVRWLEAREIPAVVNREDGQLVLRVLGCPYPGIAGEQHEICELETELFSKLVGSEMKLRRCHGTGHHCCTFTPHEETQHDEALDARTHEAENLNS